MGRIDEVLKINCTTVTVCKNKFTGRIYKDEEEMKADIADPKTDTTIDRVQQDTTVHVSPKGLEALKKFMNVKK